MVPEIGLRRRHLASIMMLGGDLPEPGQTNIVMDFTNFLKGEMNPKRF